MSERGAGAGPSQTHSPVRQALRSVQAQRRLVDEVVFVRPGAAREGGVNGLNAPVITLSRDEPANEPLRSLERAAFGNAPLTGRRVCQGTDDIIATRSRSDAEVIAEPRAGGLRIVSGVPTQAHGLT